MHCSASRSFLGPAWSEKIATHALVALVGAAAGGTGVPWLYWTLQAERFANDPQVHEVVRNAGAASATAASHAAHWMQEQYRQEMHDVEFGMSSSPSSICLSSMQWISLGMAIMEFLGIVVFIIVPCMCGPVGFLGGIVWNRPKALIGLARAFWNVGLSQMELADLAAVAESISTADVGTVRQMAEQLGVSEAALREWASLWQKAIRGPARPVH